VTATNDREIGKGGSQPFFKTAEDRWLGPGKGWGGRQKKKGGGGGGDKRKREYIERKGERSNFKKVDLKRRGQKETYQTEIFRLAKGNGGGGS